MKSQEWGIVTVLCVLLVAVGVVPSAAQTKEIQLRYANFLPATLVQSKIDQWFADELAKRSNGKIIMKIYWAEALGKAREILTMVSQGAVESGGTAPGYFPAQIPFIAAPNSLPLSIENRQQAQIIMHALWKEIPAMQDEAKQNGVYPLFWHALDSYYLVCTSPIRTLADVKGKKLRSWGEDIPRAIQVAGGIPVTVFPAELYESLQRGVLDCAVYPLDAAVSIKLHEVAKYVTLMNFGAISGWPQFYNLKLWESWPEESKKLFREIAEDAKKLELKWMQEADAKARETMKAAGVEFIDFPDQKKFESMAPDFLQDWVGKMEKLGKGADAAKMAKRWRELRARYQ